MSAFSDYEKKYECAHLQRQDGVLEVRLHTRGGSLILDEVTHRELPLLFTDIGLDPENKVVLLTGTGEVFCAELADSDWDFSTPAGWDHTYWEGRRLLQNLLDIPVPMIAAINGPARVHAEIPVLCDIVLASDTVEFQDIAHFTGFNVVPGDGAHLVWPLLLGLNRAKYFLLTEQTLSAEQARELGVVNEVLPAKKLMPRARELAAQLATRSPVTLRYTRVALNMLLRNAMQDGLSHGLALEGYSVMERAQQGS
ncbi:MAG: enoyl-CoA hydratase/isomerase family protein [Deltaproteobacteria bacterium]|nr:enoyl-CoA hydratase/isomerase family protein [Deltaproteobacteria bacterium]MBW2361237.1 enoyl-CoA hydratase/isomerase family protein [Deltaproteobacteria bacterium]